ncbi:hypothetical protein [Sphingobium lactosutens]|uniref:hypothetical protein n=1 Tax=Sphingobium lactosutens TaxID=522773 RepID=UPI0015BD03C6|nr:hypothetical protein [Sphingobium lactosutens]
MTSFAIIAKRSPVAKFAPRTISFIALSDAENPACKSRHQHVSTTWMPPLHW